MKLEKDGSLTATDEEFAREMCVNAGMIRYTPIIADVLQMLRPEDFVAERNRLVFEAIMAIHDKDRNPQHIDAAMIVDQMERSESLHKFGGRDRAAQHVQDTLDADPTGAWCMVYAENVREFSIRRQLSFLSHWLLRESASPSSSIDELISEIQVQIGSLGVTKRFGEFVHIKHAVREALDEIDSRKDGQLLGIPTGLIDIDAMTGGLPIGELTIIGARPSVGKTALGANIARNAAQCGMPVGFFSLEQSNRELAFRLLSGETGLSSMYMRRGKLKPEESKAIVAASERIQELPLWLNHHGRQTSRSITSLSRRIKLQHGIKVAFIDYLQLMTGENNRAARHEQLAEITRSLKFLARELNIAVVALAQLNRKSEDRAEEKPKLSDLKDAGAIEQDADLVILLHRKSRGDQVDQIEADVAKQRNGPTGSVNLMYRKAAMRFENGEIPQC